MRILVNGDDTYVATGGKDFEPKLPAIVFLHGAGMDHTVWALLAPGLRPSRPCRSGAGFSRPRKLRGRATHVDCGAGRLDGGAHRCHRCRRRPGWSATRWDRWWRWKRRLGIACKFTGLGLDCNRCPRCVCPTICSMPPRTNDHAAVDMIAIWGEGYRGHASAARKRRACGCWAECRAAARAGAARRHLCRFVGLQRLSGRALRRPPRSTSRRIVIQGSRDLMTPRQRWQGGRRRNRQLPPRPHRGCRPYADERSRRRRSRCTAELTPYRRPRRDDA